MERLKIASPTGSSRGLVDHLLTLLNWVCDTYTEKKSWSECTTYNVNIMAYMWIMTLHLWFSLTYLAMFIPVLMGFLCWIMNAWETHFKCLQISCQSTEYVVLLSGTFKSSIYNYESTQCEGPSMGMCKMSLPFKDKVPWISVHNYTWVQGSICD